MDFSQFSDLVLKKIVQSLPIDDVVRLGRINKRFREASVEVIKETKILNLNDEMFDDLKPYSFSILLSLCSESLEKMLFRRYDDFSMTDVFGRGTYPNLLELDMLNADQRPGVLGRILRNSKELRLLKYDEPVGNMGDVILEKLETLVTPCDDLLSGFVGRVPNLKSFEIIGTNGFDHFIRFIAGCPKLEIFKCQTWCIRSADSIRDLWRMNMKEFRILATFDRPYNIFEKIGSSFPNLEILDIGVAIPDQDDVQPLSACKELREVYLNSQWDEGHAGAFGNNFQAFGACEKLEKLQIKSWIDPNDLVTIVNSCQRLHHLTIWSVCDELDDDDDLIKTPVQAAEKAKLFHRSGVDLTIRIMNGKCARIWMSKEVRSVLQKLVDQGGSKIKFEHGKNFEW